MNSRISPKSPPVDGSRTSSIRMKRARSAYCPLVAFHGDQYFGHHQLGRGLLLCPCQRSAESRNQRKSQCQFEPRDRLPFHEVLSCADRQIPEAGSSVACQGSCRRVAWTNSSPWVSETV